MYNTYMVLLKNPPFYLKRENLYLIFTGEIRKWPLDSVAIYNEETPCLKNCVDLIYIYSSSVSTLTAIKSIKEKHAF